MEYCGNFLEFKCLFKYWKFKPVSNSWESNFNKKKKYSIKQLVNRKKHFYYIKKYCDVNSKCGVCMKIGGESRWDRTKSLGDGEHINSNDSNVPVPLPTLSLSPSWLLPGQIDDIFVHNHLFSLDTRLSKSFLFGSVYVHLLYVLHNLQ